MSALASGYAGYFPSSQCHLMETALPSCEQTPGWQGIPVCIPSHSHRPLCSNILICASPQKQSLTYLAQVCQLIASLSG